MNQVSSISAKALTRLTFMPFGDVIEVDQERAMTINDGQATRYHDLSRVDTGPDAGGYPLSNIFRAEPCSPPLTITMMENHPLGSQAFMPLSSKPYLVVVAPASSQLDVTDIKAFMAAPTQGVNHHRGVWHHPLLALERNCDFLVVDRGGPGNNVIETTLDAGAVEVIVTV